MLSKRQILAACLTVSSCFASAADLRVAIWEGAAPMYTATAQGWTGPCPDIYKALESFDPQLHFVLDSEAMPLRRVEYEMAAGRRDIVCGARKTAAREAQGLRFLNQSVQLSGYQLALRADDNIKIRSLDDIKKLGPQAVVLIIQGHGEIDRLQKLGLILDSGTPSAEQNLLKLEGGRGRFFYARETYFRSPAFNQKEHPNIRVLPTVFEPQPSYIALGTTVPKELENSLNSAFARLIRSGELKRILRNYDMD